MVSIMSLLKGDIVALDFETTGLRPYEGHRPFLIGMEDFHGNVVLAKRGTAAWAECCAKIEDARVSKICTNSKFEIGHSRHMGLKPRGKFHDTQALTVLVNEYQPIDLAGLEALHFKRAAKGTVQDWLSKNGRSLKKELGREPNYSDVPDALMLPYLENDLDLTLRFYHMWSKHVRENFGDLYEMETELAHVIVDMEDAGVCIDLEYCHAIIPRLRAEQEKLEMEIYRQAGVRFNLASPKQLGDVLCMLGVCAPGTDGKVDTSYDTLKYKTDECPFISALISWRVLSKMLDTYLIPFTQKAIGGRLHPSFWQYGKDRAIRTGRFSASDPNMQNIPKGVRGDKDALHKLGDVVRKAVIPSKGCALVFFDLAQIEMVIFTCLSKDATGIKALCAGTDLYISHAKRMFGETYFDSLSAEDRKKRRYDAKELNLSLIYGMGLASFAAKIKRPLHEAKALRNAYFMANPAAREFIFGAQRELLSKGFVKDMFGRHYHVPNNFAYKAVNALCQGTAATVMKKMLLNAKQLTRSFGARPILTIHDEIVFDVPLEHIDATVQMGKRLFESNSLLAAPIRVGVDISYTNWADKKEYTDAASK